MEFMEIGPMKRSAGDEVKLVDALLVWEGVGLDVSKVCVVPS